MAFFRKGLDYNTIEDLLKPELEERMASLEQKEMMIWGKRKVVKFYKLPYNTGFILIEKRPTSDRDRSFVHIILSQRQKLKSLLGTSPVFVLLLIKGKVQDLMMLRGGWELFLRSTRDVWFDTLVIRNDSTIYFPTSSSNNLLIPIIEKFLGNFGDISYV